MKIKDFEQSVLDLMESHINKYDRMRVWVAYKDVTNLFDLVETLDYDKSDQMQKLEDDRTYTLHKALIEFANIFMEILVQVTRQCPPKAWSIRTFAEQSGAIKVKEYVLHQAYCLNIYRSKIIVHHDVRRGSARIMYGDSTRRIAPMPHKQIDQTDVQKLQTLKVTYSAIETNPYELLNELFYSIPSPHGDKASSDRVEINNIAERGGCRSMSPVEIMETVDKFSLEIARLAPFQR